VPTGMRAHPSPGPPPLRRRRAPLADPYYSAFLLRQRVKALLTMLGLQRKPKKGIWTPTQVGDYLGVTVDLNLGMFRAPPDKLSQLAQQASSLLGRAASNARWLPARQLTAFAGKAQFLYLAVAPARFFLRELHNVLATRRGWGALVPRENVWYGTCTTKTCGTKRYSS
jgi:hypothetical protein